MRIALVANSQGTDAGVEPGTEYPALVRAALDAEHEVVTFVESGWSIRDFDAAHGDLLRARPDVVVVQVGIVEAARRILSNREKRFLRRFGRAGRKLTRILHDRRQHVIRLRHRLRLDARLDRPEEFARELDAYLGVLRGSGAEVVLLEIPPFDDEFEEQWYPLISDDLATFNGILRSRGAVPFLEASPGDFQPGTVHFTPRGHRRAADRVLSLVRARVGATV